MPASSSEAQEEEVDPGVVEGTDLRVLKYPHPSLRANDEEVTVFDDALKKTLKEMFLVMYASKGVGLAAPQVGCARMNPRPPTHPPTQTPTHA
jgi:hypothetical protein